jgi:hypothetical protein
VVRALEYAPVHAREGKRNQPEFPFVGADGPVVGGDWPGGGELLTNGNFFWECPTVTLLVGLSLPLAWS